MVNAVPARLPVKLRVSCTVTIVVWSLRPVGPEIIAPCVNVIIPIPLFKWSSWSACVAAAVETATTGIRKASSIAIAQILNFIFILHLVGCFRQCGPPRVQRTFLGTCRLLGTRPVIEGLELHLAPSDRSTDFFLADSETVSRQSGR